MTSEAWIETARSGTSRSMKSFCPGSVLRSMYWAHMLIARLSLSWSMGLSEAMAGTALVLSNCAFTQTGPPDR
ncbi:hypothetical protein D3C76_1020540 [compost metagenome]